ncbi:uncharacterized protein V1516DRAFT_682006 [Lipomyces oligophaga]|uniref:uncharacterized protein n=1 Tax=Lipomyces oligophaga TaxID=45792 RepID=UPI0034CEEFA0
MAAQNTQNEQAADYGAYVDFTDLQLDLSAFDIDSSATDILAFPGSHVPLHADQGGQQQSPGDHQLQLQQKYLQNDQQESQHFNQHLHFPDEQSIYSFHQEQSHQTSLQSQSQQYQQHQRQASSSNGVSPNSLSVASGSTVNSSVLVPVTPSSIEFSSNATFRSPSDVHDAYAMREDMMFTPLLSPAVTPLENPMMQKEFAFPSAYFSPLTSPALEAQQYPFSSASPNGTIPADTTSAVNLNKLRRRGNGSGTVFSTGLSSPSQGPMSNKGDSAVATRLSKRRATSSFLAGSGNQASSTISSQATMSGDISSSDSISPEPPLSLPESSMAPPPVPISKTAGAPNGQSFQAPIQRRIAPVTPASLMNLAKEKVSSNDAIPTRDAADAIINSVARRQQVVSPMLAPASSRSGSRSSQSQSSAIERSPSISSQSSPALRPLSRSASRTDDRQATGSTTPALRPIKPVRSRTGSISMSSPSLKPKISPNLKPLLPDGLEAASALLASKSNYQNIVEGKHSQLGLSYPEQLSINLTSKRTSHKIAEQGRRNRINSALSELNQLLVENISIADSDNEEEAKSELLPPQTSKANTVELAIDYIKKLQKRINVLKARLKEETVMVTGTSLKESSLNTSSTSPVSSNGNAESEKSAASTSSDRKRSGSEVFDETVGDSEVKHEVTSSPNDMSAKEEVSVTELVQDELMTEDVPVPSVKLECMKQGSDTMDIDKPVGV